MPQFIAVRDVPEYAGPVFAELPDLPITLAENTPRGTFVFSASATDPRGRNIRFSLPGAGNVDGPDDDGERGQATPDDDRGEIPPFAIDPTTGDITVLDPDDINDEAIDGHARPDFRRVIRLVVRATSDGPGSYSNDLTVVIYVLGRNRTPQQ